jgi:hypothetical protein
MAKFPRFQGRAASTSPSRTRASPPLEPSVPVVRKPAAQGRDSRGHRRGPRERARFALRLVLIVAVAAVWGHDTGAAAADLLAPKPETLQQLLANTAQHNTAQQARVIAEPYYVVSPPHVVAVRSR